MNVPRSINVKPNKGGLTELPDVYVHYRDSIRLLLNKYLIRWASTDLLFY